MESTILPSTFFLTFLLAIGLWFFIRASVKDRTELLRFWADADVAILEELQGYFTNRAYRIARVDPERQQLVFSGFVKPSLGLAVFLSILAGVGLLCLGLVLTIVIPSLTLACLSLVFLAPLAGWFYWQRAGRTEEVMLEVESQANEATPRQKIAITAHRDELAQLQKVFTLDLVPEEEGLTSHSH